MNVNQIFEVDKKNRQYVKINNKRTYVYKQGTTNLSTGFKKKYREGDITILPQNLSVAYNKFSKRFVPREKIYKKNGEYRIFYQRLLDEEEKEKRRLGEEEEDKKNLAVIRNQALPMSEWSIFVETQLNSKLSPFKLTLISGIIGGLIKTFNFRNFYHFENWLKIVIEGAVVETGSENIDEMDGLRGALDLAMLTVQPIFGGCNHKCGGSVVNTFKKFNNTRWKFECYNPVSKENQCAFKCLEYILKRKLNIHSLRKQFKLERNVMVDIEMLHAIYMQERTDNMLLDIVDRNYEGDIELDTIHTILTNKDHYYVVVKAEKVPYKDVKCKRGDLSFDFETRPDFNDFVYVGDKKSELLKDTICAIHYRFNRSFDYHRKVFVTNREKSSSRQFLDWLQEQHYEKHHFNIVGHNASRFDNYFLVSQFTENEQLQTPMQLRGTSIIGMQYYSHLIKDSCCFLTNSLSNLCDDYKIKTKKLTNFIHKGIELTNMNLCFYKPELDFWDFMELEKSDPEFWRLYTDYCISDVESLSELWTRFTNETNNLVEQMRPDLLQKCPVMSCNTIGSLAKKLIDKLQVKSKDFKLYNEFLNNDDLKYKYVCGFKRGGISHCNQPGKHNTSISSFDITSQYPSAMINMIIPSGESNWTDKYDPKMYGYYTIKNLKFNNNKFKPLAYSEKGKSLNWAYDWKEDDEVNVGSELLKYLMETQGLETFDVIKGLVSKKYTKGYKLFGKYVYTLFESKAEQDVLKDFEDDERKELGMTEKEYETYKIDEYDEYKKQGTEKELKERYNPSRRNVIKLLLNSVTGKLVEDPSRYFTLKYSGDETTTNLNGIGIIKEKKDENMNIWVNAGCCVYDYSKMLLFKYIECLPNGSDDVVHVETDSIYFSTSNKEQFIKNVALKTDERIDYPIAINIGLGNVKQEHETVGEAYFNGKKNYYLKDTKGKQVMRMKGIPLTSLDKHGNKYQIVDKSFYERIYAGEVIESRFTTMTKALFGTTAIRAHYMTRTTRSLMPLYEWNDGVKTN